MSVHICTIICLYNKCSGKTMTFNGTSKRLIKLDKLLIWRALD